MTVGTASKPRVVKAWLVPVVLVALFYLVIGIGVLTGNWHSKIPYDNYKDLIPEVQKEYANRR
jgi:hypothetical protein